MTIQPIRTAAPRASSNPAAPAGFVGWWLPPSSDPLVRADLASWGRLQRALGAPIALGCRPGQHLVGFARPIRIDDDADAAVLALADTVAVALGPTAVEVLGALGAPTVVELAGPDAPVSGRATVGWTLVLRPEEVADPVGAVHEWVERRAHRLSVDELDTVIALLGDVTVHEPDEPGGWAGYVLDVEVRGDPDRFWAPAAARAALRAEWPGDDLPAGALELPDRLLGPAGLVDFVPRPATGDVVDRAIEIALEVTDAVDLSDATAASLHPDGGSER